MSKKATFVWCIILGWIMGAIASPVGKWIDQPGNRSKMAAK